MTKALNGPAAGVTLLLKRAPRYMRFTLERGTHPPKWDALDQLTDVAVANEHVFAYKRASETRTAHINFGRKGCGWFTGADYEFVSPQPEEAVLRDNAQWQAWTVAQAFEGTAALEQGPTV